MTSHPVKPVISILAFMALAGCTETLKTMHDTPALSPMGQGLQYKEFQSPLARYQPPAHKSYQSMWDSERTEFFKEPRAKSVGDVLTVAIDISDEANLDNESDRSRSSNNTSGLDFTFGLFGFEDEGSGDLDIGSDTASRGRGEINRSEKISLQVAAVVTQKLPNGNLVISGTQEVRVNNEVRVLNVEGIVRPRDIGPENTITYDKIAEARISYGGRGHVSEMQKPAWGQRIYETITPF
ncbi:flagellar basal body L-ring protein FlgH [uncultured Cohaesibacter sp.]|uniref:flagellar basal body L-ring protein FlgH n=1 Tax=uncultured Cohaesibacter sp. TaxID=1002546 RepID=UPI0029C9B180|nr:flagellar basal body L-ring protein FlgH [uncultured Cohaesibacter sp.]